MWHKKQVFFLFLSFFLFFNILGQDLIIQKKGTKIYCKIVREDSVLIFYKLPGQNTQFQISKTEVEKHYVSSRADKKKTGKKKKVVN
jgi:hypothetical protein